MAVSRGLLLLLLAIPSLAQNVTPVEDLQVRGWPGDDGTALLLSWKKMPYDGPEVTYTIEAAEGDGAFTEADSFPSDQNLLTDPKVRESLKLPIWIRSFLYSHDNHRHMVKIDSVGGKPISENVKDKKGNVEKDGSGKPKEHVYHFRVVAASKDGGKAVSVTVSETPREHWFDPRLLNNLVFMVLFCGVVLYCIRRARRNPHTFLRRIAGLDAIEEAIGRATEMGRPVYYVIGRMGMDDMSTIAGTVVLGRVARRIAEYDTQLRVPHRDPVVLSFCQEVVREAYHAAGRPDAYKEDSNFFLTSDQFSYAAAVNGMMVRERPAAIVYMGNFMAESLLLAEVGASTGAIQVAGTDETSQLPFFVTACDYTLIGEELYAASAYLSREPVQVGTLRGQDFGKLLLIAAILLFSALAWFGVDAALDVVREFS